jgi:DNA-binding NarL/FixJ family response regulator
VRVIVAEDNFLRELLVRYLPEHGIEVTGQAPTTQELFDLVEAGPPSLVTIDFEMPRRPGTKPEYGAGLDAAREIRCRYPDVAILGLSQYPEVSWAEEIAALGDAVGYQLKDRVAELDRLIVTMREVAAGAVRMDETLVRALLQRRRVDDPVQRLSPREREVLALMAQGLSNTAIAKQLHIQERTVEGHETSIYRTLCLTKVRDPGGDKPKVNVRVMAVLEFLKRGRPDPAKGPEARHGIVRQRHFWCASDFLAGFRGEP